MTTLTPAQLQALGERPIPGAVTREQVVEALGPLFDLLGVTANHIPIGYPIIIDLEHTYTGKGSISFPVVATDHAAAEFPEAFPAYPRFIHPQQGVHAENAELTFFVRVAVAEYLGDDGKPVEP